MPLCCEPSNPASTCGRKRRHFISAFLSPSAVWQVSVMVALPRFYGVAYAIWLSSCARGFSAELIKPRELMATSASPRWSLTGAPACPGLAECSLRAPRLVCLSCHARAGLLRARLALSALRSASFHCPFASHVRSSSHRGPLPTEAVSTSTRVIRSPIGGRHMSLC